jgi:hypothetical protein
MQYKYVEMLIRNGSLSRRDDWTHELLWRRGTVSLQRQRIGCFIEMLAEASSR